MAVNIQDGFITLNITGKPIDYLYLISADLCATIGENPGKIPGFSARSTGVGRNLRKYDVITGYK